MKKNANHPRRFLPDDPSFQVVYEVGTEIINEALGRAKKQFERCGKSLHYREYMEGFFRASAHSENSEGQESFITFDRIVPWVLFEGISKFVDMAAVCFGTDECREIFKDSIGPTRQGILPEGWDALECRDTIFERALTWLFHHELGHLFQGHERIRKANAPEGSHITMFVDEVMSESDALAADSDLSWLYHATELAADHQALHYSLFYQDSDQLTASAKNVSPGSIWCFVCAMAYMFHYFFADGPNTESGISPVAVGSHPDPTVRLAMLTRHLCQFFGWNSVRSDAPSAPVEAEVETIVTDAEVAMNVYWSLTHGDKTLRLTDVLGRLIRFDVEVLEYGQKLARIWGEWRVEVLRIYFGENRSHVMGIDAPLGSSSSMP